MAVWLNITSKINLKTAPTPVQAKTAEEILKAELGNFYSNSSRLDVPTIKILMEAYANQKQADILSRLTESLKTIYSLAKHGSAIYDICDKTLNPPQTDKE